MVNETETIEPIAYFSHYFREWGGKSSALSGCREYAIPENEYGKEYFELCKNSLNAKVMTFEERIGEDHPEGLRAAKAEFSDEVAALNELAHKYNSSYVDFTGQPDFEGIEKLIAEADSIRERGYNAKGI